MSEEENKNEIEKIAAKWKNKRGSLIMALHDIQDSKGYIPWKMH
jgi:NADH:ubiquinone oxidoreductase subunit E